MPKAKADKVEEVNIAAEETSTPVVKKYPEVSATGRFQVVSFEEGYVVYNPDAIRVTDVISKNKAEDIVRDQNRAAQIKG